VGTLFLVATPIGNLDDMSARGIRTLRDVGLIAAEDTRVTRKLLSRFDIHTPLTSYFEHNKVGRLPSILAKLSQGDVALVSDAGTPGLNDPGFELVTAAVEAGHKVSIVPGPASPIAALVCSGLPTDTFLYLGYLPRNASQRRDTLEHATSMRHTLIFLESPHRLRKSLEDMRKVFGDRRVAIARELTKLHEEIWRGTLGEALARFENPRGEFVVVVAPAPSSTSKRWSNRALEAAIRRGKAGGASPKSIAANLSAESGWPRREIYRLAVGLK
jgi:16S rRNA (cytidine1402-2'-O)-methyltransferase